MGRHRALPEIFGASEIEIEQLKEKHKIPRQFDLVSELRNISFDYSSRLFLPKAHDASHRARKLTKRSRVLSAEEINAFAQNVLTKARELQALLSGASDDELAFLIYGGESDDERSRLIYEATAQPRFTYRDLLQLAQSLRMIERAASDAAAVSQRRGPKSDAHLLYLVNRLSDTYADARKWNDAERRCESSKADESRFVKDVLPYFGVTLKNRELEYVLRKIRKARGECVDLLP